MLSVQDRRAWSIMLFCLAQKACAFGGWRECCPGGTVSALFSLMGALQLRQNIRRGTFFPDGYREHSPKRHVNGPLAIIFLDTKVWGFSVQL